MSWVKFHDHLNPSTEVPVDTAEIEGVTPFGSGSSLHMKSGNAIGVHETPAEVAKILEG